MGGLYRRAAAANKSRRTHLADLFKTFLVLSTPWPECDDS